MSDPSTIHQPGLGTRVLVKIGLGIVGCLAAVLAVALAAMYGQVVNARVEIGFMRTGLSALNDRLGRIEKAVDEARARLSEILLNEQRTGSVTPDVPVGFYVTQQEARLIREFLKVPPKNANAAAKIALWIRVPAQGTKPLPEGLVGKLEKLKGLRYAIDANNAIALIEASTNIVIAVI